MMAIFREWTGRAVPLLRSPRYMLDLAASGLALFLLGWGYLYWFLGPIYGALAPNPVSDRLLQILPTIDLNYAGFAGIIVAALSFGAWTAFRVPEKAPFVLKIYTLVIFAKNLVGPITNLTQPEGAIADTAHDTIFNDLFFSGHTATMFTFYLLARASMPRLRFFWLGLFVFEAAVVLLMKLHYTIDVVAAPFIAYGLFMLGQRYLGKNKVAYERLLPPGTNFGKIE